MVLNATMVMQRMQSGKSVGEIKYKISYLVTAHHMHRDYKRIEWAFRSKSRDKLKHLMGAKSRSLIG